MNCIFDVFYELNLFIYCITLTVRYKRLLFICKMGNKIHNFKGNLYQKIN